MGRTRRTDAVGDVVASATCFEDEHGMVGVLGKAGGKDEAGYMRQKSRKFLWLGTHPARPPPTITKSYSSSAASTMPRALWDAEAVASGSAQSASASVEVVERIAAKVVLRRWGTEEKRWP